MDLLTLKLPSSSKIPNIDNILYITEKPVCTEVNHRLLLICMNLPASSQQWHSHVNEHIAMIHERKFQTVALLNVATNVTVIASRERWSDVGKSRGFLRMADCDVAGAAYGGLYLECCR